MSRINYKEALFKLISERTRSIDWDQLDLLSALSIANKLNISRNMASQYLNEYVASEQLIKINTRPVYFFAKKELQQAFPKAITKQEYVSISELREELDVTHYHSSIFHSLIGYKGSLSNCITQCKAAITYPNNGLPILLQGPTGTGKSMIAQLIYQYGVERDVISCDGKFVVVNCSEYANNPELLLTNLFGYKKGAYTGADKDKEGLIALANGGVLFLDEVHCLKAECQEKLFLFMDKGIYHMVGDNETWYQSKVRFIFATTENPETALLKTFLRRIPLISVVPSLAERPLLEKRQLIFQSIQKESQTIGKQIQISHLAFHAIESYPFTQNVGQLVNCIKATVANTFLQSQDDEQSILYIHMNDLPDFLLQSDSIPYHLDQYDDKTMLTQEWLNQTEPTNSKLYELNRDLLSLLHNHLDHQVDANEFLTIGYLKLEPYFDYLHFTGQKTPQPKEKLTQDFMENICEIISQKHGISFSPNAVLHLSRFVSDFIRYESTCQVLYKKHINDMNECLVALKEHSMKDYEINANLATLIEDTFNIHLGEIGLIDLFLLLKFFQKQTVSSEQIGVILAHGYSTATSIATTVNHLIGQSILHAIDVPVNAQDTYILKNLQTFYEKQEDSASDKILFTDMPLSQDLIAELERNINYSLLVVEDITTYIVATFTKQLLEGETVQSLAENVHLINMSCIQRKEKPLAILSVCATGIGTAQKISNLLESSFPKKVDVEFLTYDYQSLASMGLDCPVFDKYQVLFIVGTSDPKIQHIPFISVEDFVEQKNNEKINLLLGNLFDTQELNIFNQNLIKNFSMQNLLNTLTILNPEKIVNHVESIIKTLQEKLQITLQSSTVVGLYLHISCLIERLITNRYIVNYHKIEQFEKENQAFIQIVQEAFTEVERTYSVTIPISEIGYIYEYIFPEE